jgi:hypothetical protein
MLAVGSALRIAYALGLMLAPEAMSARRLAARHDSAYGRMTTRAFGAVHVNVALLSLRAALLDRDVRLALALNTACDFGDLVATVLEWQRGGDLPMGALIGSAAVQSTGMAIWTSGLRALS